MTTQQEKTIQIVKKHHPQRHEGKYVYVVFINGKAGMMYPEVEMARARITRLLATYPDMVILPEEL
jgi:hypothetical protein